MWLFCFTVKVKEYIFVLVLSLASAKEGKYMLCIHKPDLPFFNLTFASLSWHHVNKISIVD